MATGYLGTDCAVLWGNTGIAPCPYHPKQVEGFLLVPKSTSWTTTQIAALQTTITTGIANVLPTSRYYPITRFEDIEDKGTDAVETETGYGVAKFVRNGKYRWRGIYSNGALDMHAELSKFNGLQDRFDAFIILKGNYLLGTASGESSIKGFSLDTMYSPNIKINTGGEDTKYAFEIGLEDEEQLNKYFRVITVPDTLPIVETFTGLKPTRIEVVEHLDASDDDILVRLWSGSTNLYDAYAGDIDVTSLWHIVNLTLGTTTTASSFPAPTAGDIAAKAFRIIFTGASTAAAEEAIIKFGSVTLLTGFANSQATTTTVA